MTIRRRQPGLIFLILLFLCLAGASRLHALAPAKGMFLVAAVQTADPRFHEGVILLIQHDAEGSAGLVVNRTSRLELAKILPPGSRLSGAGVPLAYGGPVEPQALLALVKVRSNPPEPADEVLDGLYVTGVGVLDEWPDFAAEVETYRAFTGYTGWAPGQLQLEMQRGDWLLAPADVESVLKGDEGQLWSRLHELLEERE